MSAWTDFWEAINVLQLMAWVLGILGVLAFFVKGWPFIRQTFRMLDALSTLPEDIAGLQADMKVIRHEVMPNGGTSMKDAVLRIEVEQAHSKRQRGELRKALVEQNVLLTEHLKQTKEK